MVQRELPVLVRVGRGRPRVQKLARRGGVPGRARVVEAREERGGEDAIAPRAPGAARCARNA